MDRFLEFLSKLKDVFASFSPAKKVSLLAVTVIALASIGFIVYYSGQVDYRVLFSSLSNGSSEFEQQVNYRRALQGELTRTINSVAGQTEEKDDPGSPVVRSVKKMTDKTAAPSTWRENFSFFLPLIKYLLAFIAVIVLIMFFLRPLLKEVMKRDISRSIGELGRMAAGNASGKDAVNISTFSETGEPREVSDRDIAKRLAEEDAKKFAEILKTWLK